MMIVNDDEGIRIKGEGEEGSERDDDAIYSGQKKRPPQIF